MANLLALFLLTTVIQVITPANATSTAKVKPAPIIPAIVAPSEFDEDELLSLGFGIGTNAVSESEVVAAEVCETSGFIVVVTDR